MNKIQIKKIKIAQHLSQETTAFSAEIFIDGICAGYARNDGNGGCDEFNPYDKAGADLFKKVGYKAIEDALMKQITEFELAKEKKKLEKKMVNHVMWGIPNGGTYTQVKFKIPLASIPAIQLQPYIDKYKREFKKGEQFLNTNLEKLGIKI